MNTLGLDESWRPVVGYEGLYEVSNFGRVKSVRAGRCLKANSQKSGHLSVSLCVCGKPKTINIHKLVALAFLGPRPPGLEVRHLDGVCTNNHVGNLEYGTRRKNVLDSYDHGVFSKGEEHHLSRFSDKQISAVMALKGHMNSDLASLISGISARHIRDLWSGKKRNR